MISNRIQEPYIIFQLEKRHYRKMNERRQSKCLTLYAMEAGHHQLDFHPAGSHILKEQ
jgi:hypothetical protein